MASSWPAPKRGTDGLHRASWAPGLSGSLKTSREGGPPPGPGWACCGTWGDPPPGVQTPPLMAGEFRVADSPGREVQLAVTSHYLLCCAWPGPTGVMWKL